MRYIHIAAAVGIAVAVPFSAPVVLGAPSAHADTAINNFVRCVQNNAGIPPRQSAEDWVPTVQIIESRLNAVESPDQVAQELTGMGAKPNDAVVEVQCVIATNP